MLTIYKASAGSGKTFKLTQQFLTYLLGEKITLDDGTTKWRPATGHNRHRQILAITFTNKATTEMKSRIIEHLSRLSGNGKRSDYVDYLTKKLGIDEDKLKVLSNRALKEILFDYQNFNVSTIDSFFQQILRSLAFELDRPGDYSMEIEQTNVASEGARRLMSAFNNPIKSDKDPGNPTSNLEILLKQIMKDRSESGSSANIFNSKSGIFNTISSYATDLYNERFKLIGEKLDPLLHDELLRKKMQKALEAERDLTINRLKKKCDIIRTKYANEWDYLGANRVKNPIEKFKDGKLPDFTTYKANKSYPYWYKPQNDLEGFFTKKGRDIFPNWESTVINLAADLRQCLELIKYHEAIQALINELPAYEFMAAVQEHIDKYRIENSVVVLADVNSILNKIMSYDDDVPFVYEKMAMRLEHFLIDEFQDTSRMQWDNLSPMVHNSVAYGNDNLIIGDEKQAIYRFRNSDSSMLHEGVANDKRFTGNVNIEGDTIDQNTNWRTVPEIVNFNNCLFDYLAKKLTVAGYENVKQQVAKKNSHLNGYVLFQPFASNVISFEDSAEDIPAEDAILDTMVQHIKRQREAGYLWKEIAVLSNTNEQCERVVHRLQAENIPVATTDALFIASSPLVRMIMSAMQLIYNASSDSDMLKSSAGKLTLFKIHFEFEYARLLNQGIAHEEAMQKATESIMKRNEENTQHNSVSPTIQAVIDRNPATIIELAETILRECALRAPQDSMTDLNSYDLTPGEKTYMAALCDEIDDFVEMHGNDLAAFLKYWKNQGSKITINGAQTTDMVNVMTIHKSKGLEYECVHIPYVNYNLAGKNSNSAVWITPDDAPGLPWSEPDIPQAMLVKLKQFATLEGSPLYPVYERDLSERITDGLNKTYVGFTRPVRELCVYYDYSKDFGSQLAEAFAKLYAGKGYDTDTNVLELGSHTTPDRKEDETKKYPTPESVLMQPEKPTPFYAVAYNDAAEGVTRMSSTVPGDPEPEVGIEDDEDPNELAKRMAADRGTRLHLVLSRVAHSARLKNALHRFARHLEPGDEETLRDMFSNPATAEYVKRWYTHGTKSVNEVSVLGGPDHKNPSKRIDRLVFHPDGSVDVIDFKFTTTEDTDHHTQVADYMTLMRLSYPGATVRGYLWYVDQHRVVEVKP